MHTCAKKVSARCPHSHEHCKVQVRLDTGSTYDHRADTGAMRRRPQHKACPCNFQVEAGQLWLHLNRTLCRGALANARRHSAERQRYIDARLACKTLRSAPSERSWSTSRHASAKMPAGSHSCHLRPRGDLLGATGPFLPIQIVMRKLERRALFASDVWPVASQTQLTIATSCWLRVSTVTRMPAPTVCSRTRPVRQSTHYRAVTGRPRVRAQAPDVRTRALVRTLWHSSRARRPVFLAKQVWLDLHSTRKRRRALDWSNRARFPRLHRSLRQPAAAGR